MLRSRSTLACAALAGAFAAAVYARTVGFGFAYDDDLVVLRNPAVTGHSWRAIASTPYHQGADVRVASGLYRPLTSESFALNHLVSRDRAWSYHLVNVLLHALATGLVLLFGEALGLSTAAAAAGSILFAVHPVHVEAVANVSGRAELLATAAFLAACLAYARLRGPSGRLTRAGTVTTAALFAASLLAKENALTFLAVAAAWEALRRRLPGETPSSARTAAANLAVPSAVAAVYLGLRTAVLGGLLLGPGAVTPIENPVVGLPAAERTFTVLAVFGRASALLVTPVRLAPDYGFAEIVPVRSRLDPGALVGAVMLAAALAAVGRTAKRQPRIAFLILFALATYAIVSNAFLTIGTILGDRLLYLPSAACCLLAGLAAEALARRFGWRSAMPVVGVAAALLLARAWSYTSVWRSDRALFAYAVEATPNSIRALCNRASDLARDARFDEATVLLDRALTLAPDVIPVLLNRGAVALARHDLNDAERYVRRVLQLDPSDPVARDILARIDSAR